ncbi:hypothetical protein GPA10_26050 [Streptomyces sp. p1417]|uniref:Uncharacterized protein n=1 Tax=Streptomyces typhae TaxID=2681492 RepID=A0A6L6X360_9ACTN|nr:hypothetical protein [Streptomyces typhae]MVO88126.1 hypothetical protein [Streptomyces typhae]
MALLPELLFPEVGEGGRYKERHGEAAALTAVATAFGTTLPRLALTRGRLHTFTTRSWTRPPGPGEVYATATLEPLDPDTVRLLLAQRCAPDDGAEPQRAPDGP